MKSDNEDISYRLKSLTRGGKEPYFLKHRYQVTLPTDMQKSLTSDSASIDALNHELHIFDGCTINTVLENHDRRFTIAVFYRPQKVC